MSELSEYVRIDFPCELTSVARIDTYFREVLLRAGLEETVAGDIQLCVNEAVANAIDHGSQFRGEMSVVLEYRIEPGRIVVLLTDSGGKAFDPGFFRELAFRKDWSVGGRGILIMAELMDEVSYFFVPGHRTTVMLVKRLAPGEQTAAICD